MPDDVGSGAVKYLNGVSAVTALLGSYPATDPNNAGKAFIFKSDASGYRGILTRIQSTSSAGLVLSSFGGYSVPPPLTTPRFLRLSVEVYVDPLRDAQFNVIETAGATQGRGETVFDAIHFALHRTNPDMQLWGDLRTTGCQLLTDPMFMILAGGDGDGLLRGQAFYGVDTFGYSDALTG
jgi:hypothetical protein